MSKIVTVEAGTVIARSQFSCYGPMQIFGNIECRSPTACIAFGQGQKLRLTNDGIAATIGSTDYIFLGKTGLSVNGGLSFANNPAIVITGIVNTANGIATAGSLQGEVIATAAATKAYIDGRLLSATIERLSVGTLTSPGGAAITISGNLVLNGQVTFGGSLRYTMATVRAMTATCAHTVTTPIVFVECATTGNIIDINTAPGTEQVVQFINVGMNDAIISQPALLRFCCGCAWLDNALKVSRQGNRWACLHATDGLFPTRVSSSAIVTNIVSSTAVNASGCLIAVGNATDGGERGCAHLFYRADRTWVEASPKIVGSCTLATRHQGQFCALNASVLAVANEREIWLFSIGTVCGSFHVKNTTEIAHVSLPESLAANIASIHLSANGRVLLVTTESGCAIYDIAIAIDGAGAPSGASLRYTSALFRDPAAINGDGSICYAVAPDNSAIVRVELAPDRANCATVTALGAPIARLGCNARGDAYVENCACSCAMRTVISAPDARTIEVQHEGAVFLRTSFPFEIRSFTVSQDGALAVICLTNGEIRVIY